jgi:hypothetical protein
MRVFGDNVLFQVRPEGFFKSCLRGLKGGFTIDPSKNPEWAD